MLGAIFGDIVGSVYEFNPTQDYHFPLLTEESTLTDDTICTIAIANACMHGRDCYRYFLRKWCAAYPYPMGGYGARFSEWLRSPNPCAYYSWGNGSAMRVSSLGWLCSSIEEVLQEATYSAACTHNHPDGIRGAQAVAAAVYLARTGMSKDELLAYVRDEFDYPTSYYDENGDVDYCLDDYRGHFDESCEGTVSAALLCIRDSHDFESAIRLAVSLGADADTLGAIVGAIAEPLYGMPLEFKEEVLKRLPEDMLDVYSQFKKSISL